MKNIYSFLLVFSPFAVEAQDPFFIQAYSNPLLLNPSFAGSAGCSRVVTDYRNQWPANTANYATSTFSYDKHINALHGGLGFNYLQDNAGSSSYKTTSVGVIYSPTFIIKKKVSIKPSIETNFFQKSLDYSQLTFGDMIAPGYGFVYNTLETPSYPPKTGFDFSSGILINTTKWNFGTAIYHLNQPEEGILSVSPLNRKISVHASYTFSKNDSANFSFTPAVFLIKQGDQHLLMTTMNFKYKWVRWGAGIHSGNDLIVMLGCNLKRFKINYSYDFQSSNVSNTGGAHEISITCLFQYKKKVKITEQVKDEQNPEVKKDIEKTVIKPVKYNVIPLKTNAF